MVPVLLQPFLWMSEGQWVRKPFEDMLRLMDSKTRNFCPSDAKAARFQASLSSWVLPRGTVPAQPSNGFFLISLRTIRYCPILGKCCVFSESTGLSFLLFALRLRTHML